MTKKVEQSKPLTPKQAEELVKHWDATGGIRTSAYYRLKQLATESR
jgi:hypothetical protein